MAKAPKKPASKPKKKAPAKGASPRKSTPAPKKEKFDTTAFVFNYPVEEIQKAISRLEEQDADPMAEPLTDDQLYWWAVWEMQLPEVKRRGMSHVPTCAVENAVLKLPRLGGKK